MDTPNKRRRKSRAKVVPAVQSAAPEASSFVIGIGASAGGLEALVQFLSNLPAGLGAPIIVIQHLSPTHKSMLVQLLARQTTLAVTEAKDGDAPEGDHIYVAPPNHNLALNGGVLHLSRPAMAGAPKPSVDMFFESLAAHAGENAIGVVLSGTGSDGAKGIRSIKAVGGFTFAQEPATAKYDGMPSAALVTGHVDQVLSPAAIAEAIAHIVRNKGGAEGVLKEHAPPDQLKQLMHRLRARTRLDFSGYKDATVLRRIERRMVANRVSALDEYINVIGMQPEELDRLAKDILISVTSFFRDRAAFKALGTEIARVITRKRANEELRIWVAGCATGEEAYSIAMLSLDLIERAESRVRLQIFATDVDLDAIAVARRGLYTDAAVNSIPKEWLARYFVSSVQGYEAKPVLRDCIVFSRQDLVQDPPFPRIDVISCRNLLIYFQPALQARVVPLMHYALRSGGLLFLGKSETLNQFDELFEPVDKQARLYRSRGARQLPVGLTRAAEAQGVTRLQSAEPSMSLEQRLLQAAAGIYFPPMALLSRDFEVRHTYGDVSKFFTFPAGRPSLELGKVIKEDFSAEAQALLLQARKTRDPARGRPRKVNGESAAAVRLVAHCVVFDQDEHLLLGFESIDPEAAVDTTVQGEGEAAVIRELQEQLIAAREHVQSVVEELETSNEEMQALNEELQSANEELQSSNEELETSNEELQSTNEELITVNDELHLKTVQLSDANIELENIINSAGYPLLVFDGESELTRFNAQAAALFGLGVEIAGRRASELQLPEQIGSFVRKLDVAIQQRSPYEEEVQIEERNYILRISPCLIKGGEKSGAIVSLLDITALSRAKAALVNSEQRLRSMMQHSPALVYLTRPDGVIEYVNPGFERVFRIKGSAVSSRHEDEVLPRQTADLMRKGRLAAIEQRDAVESEETYPGGEGPRHFIAVRFPLFDEHGEIEAVCAMLLDITVRKQVEEALKLSESRLRQVLDALPAEVVVLDRSGKIVQVNAVWERFGLENGVAPDRSNWIGMNYFRAARTDGTDERTAEEASAAIQAVLSGQRSSFTLEYPCHSDSSKRWFVMHVSPLPQDEGAVILHQDVTDRHLIEQQLAEMNETLERRVTDRTRELNAVNKELETFAFSISHDLQSPLRAVSGFSTLVLSEYGDSLGGDGKGYLRRIVQACERMSALIDELLELSRLARRELLLSDVDLSAMATEIVEGMRAGDREREIEVVIEPGLSARCDPHLVHALLHNLLSNAWKFTSRKRNPRIDVGRALSRGTCAFFVRDNGVGFDMKYSAKLFRPFQRLHDVRDFIGNGLGLTNVMRIARRHGGEVWAEAVEGAGATFFFTLGQN
jgi:two-component system CheB/CheR fusion protein